MSASSISSVELIARAGITYRQLDYWTRRGLLHEAGGVQTPGSGRHRRFEVCEVRVARLLLVVGPGGGPGGGGFGHVELAAERVRAGATGQLELVPGVLVDLDYVCGEVACVDAV